MKNSLKVSASILFFLVSIFSFAQTKPLVQNKVAKWFPQYDFNQASFQKPALEFAPFARWWWPGNHVTKEELKRELNLFAVNKFGGVEIQPINLFVPGTNEDLKKVLSWDTPEYYENVKLVMEEARKLGLTIDMTDGSGWPPGAPNLSVEDGFHSLQSTSFKINGGEPISLPLELAKNKTGIVPKFVAAIASKYFDPKTDIKTIPLDESSLIDISKYVKNDSLYWTAPIGNWKIIAIWKIPSGEKGMAATPVQVYVVDHFDSTKVLKNYSYLFGERTGLSPYFGNPMRSIFNDSYEFEVDRFFSKDFISYFLQHRKYNITSYLPIVLQKGYNYASYKRPKAVPEYSISSEDWRIKYDYDLTLSELLGEHFFKTSENWMKPKGLLHRTQAYGLNMDMIAQAGLASIPETESMLGPEANLKVMTSGGHLYNRPIISAESVVFVNRAYNTTPQKIKIAVDKLFAAGVNQIVYHGIPYKYNAPTLGPEGWYPFSSPLLAMVNFSSNLGEGNIFWKYQKEVNEYVNRTQYALRAGKPHADVLIYFPFMDVDGLPDNPEEILTDGYIKEVEGPLPIKKDKPNLAKIKWAEKVYPFINQLEANGITWDWVNDVSIQEAKLTNNKQINIRGNIYQVLILANDSILQLKTAQKIQQLASEGMQFIATGDLPTKQPSYLNWKENDLKTAQFIKSALRSSSSKYLNNEIEINAWIKSLQQSVKFNGQYHFTRQIQREMTDGSRIQFVWNKSDQWQTITFSLNKKYKSSYWMNATDGSKMNNNGSLVTYQLPPFGSVILYASTNEIINNQNLPTPSFDFFKSKEVLNLNQWNLKTDSFKIVDTTLFDWKINNQLKYSSSEGVYTTNFHWDSQNYNAQFYLDLGKVCFTAEVWINGNFAGRNIFSPYVFEISKLLQNGSNQIEVRVTTGQLNGYIGKAKQGDAHFKQFNNKEDQLMSGGLIGPVKIVANIKSEKANE
jgi:hypothetical protein